MPGMGGLELLKKVRDSHLEIAVIMITALVLAVHRAMERQPLLEEVRNLRSALDERYGFENIVGRSKRLLHVLEMASRVAHSRARMRPMPARSSWRTAAVCF
jgi:DNA-binding NtrC family response regulator